MTFRISLILYLACFSLISNAQKFQPGYYVTLSGDTVRTEIFVQKLYASPIGIQLKNGRTLGPSSVKGIGTKSAFYTSKIFMVDKSPNQGEVLDTAFLEVIVRGKISLLYYRDEAPKTHFFIQKEDRSLEELGLKILDLGDHKQFTQLTTYKDVLKKNFPNCTDLFPEIDKTTYDRFDVQQIFLKLYKCQYGQEVPGSNIRERAFIEFGLTAGAVQNSIAFKNDSYSPYTYMNFSKSTSFAGGGYLEVISPRIRFFYLRNELLFSSYESSAPEVVVNPDPFNERRAAAGLKNSYLRYNLLFRKNLGNNRILPFINIGGSVSYLMSHNGYQTDIRSIDGAIYFNEEFPFAQSSTSIEIGAIAGIGATINKLGFEVRYELSSGMRPVDYTSVGGGLFITALDPASPVNSLYFLLSYQLGNNRKLKTVK